MECQGKEKKMVLVGLRERTGKRDGNPVGDVAVGELLWPFFFSFVKQVVFKHRLQLSKAMGLFGGSCFSAFFWVLVAHSKSCIISSCFC